MNVRLVDRSYQYPVGIAENMLVEVGKFTFPADRSYQYTDEILEEDFDALLDEGSKILHSIEGTLLKEEIFAEFDEFMAMTANENSIFQKFWSRMILSLGGWNHERFVLVFVEAAKQSGEQHGNKIERSG
ncbi:hypothetical protein Tco_0889080 [Tanacetum coccineum]